MQAHDLAAAIPNREGTVRLYENLDLTVQGGESVSILGRSGSGKSTLLSTLGLMQRPASGRLVVGGYDATAISEAQAARLRNELIGFVFQNYSLVPHLSVFENVGVPLSYGRRVSRKEAKKMIMRSLDYVGLAGRANEKPLRLSGGEQQRVAIARALVRNPPIVLADEPTGSLDTETATHVLEVLRAATIDAGSCLIIVTHDLIVAQSTNRAYSLYLDGLRPEKLEATPQ